MEILAGTIAGFGLIRDLQRIGETDEVEKMLIINRLKIFG